MSAEWDKVEECAENLRLARWTLNKAASERNRVEQLIMEAQTEYDRAHVLFRQAFGAFAPGWSAEAVRRGGPPPEERGVS